MKPISCILLFSSMTLFMLSCASTSPARWDYEEKAINLNFEVEKKLNVRDNTSHTLSVCVFQLREPNAFKQLAEDTDGLYKLLECGTFDPSVASARRVIVNPGKSQKVVLDRAEGAKFVGIVAGYYNIDRKKIVRFYRIPKEKRGLFSKTMVPMPLNATIKLGPKQITSAQED